MRKNTRRSSDKSSASPKRNLEGFSSKINIETAEVIKEEEHEITAFKLKEKDGESTKKIGD